MLVDFKCCKCSRVKIFLLQDMMGHGSPWLQRVDSNILQRSSQLSWRQVTSWKADLKGDFLLFRGFTVWQKCHNLTRCMTSQGFRMSMPMWFPKTEDMGSSKWYSHLTWTLVCVCNTSQAWFMKGISAENWHCLLVWRFFGGDTDSGCQAKIRQSTSLDSIH